MRLPAWLKATPHRRHRPGFAEFTITADISKYVEAMNAAARQAGRTDEAFRRFSERWSYAQVLDDVRREARAIVRSGLHMANPWLRLPEPQETP